MARCQLYQMPEGLTFVELILVPSNEESSLSSRYANAFLQATELFVVNAYLTEWNSALKLGATCKVLRIIVGRDYGITRKDACRDVLKWLPKGKKFSFQVAEIGGFHPKTIIWKNKQGEAFAIVGSSNLTKAAFHTNYEANFFSALNREDYAKARAWIAAIEKSSVPVSEDWLKTYVEAERRTGKTSSGKKLPFNHSAPTLALELPQLSNALKLIKYRRKQLKWHSENRQGLLRLFRRCADGSITSLDFYEELPSYWSYKEGNRLQGKGWEMKGAAANFTELSRCFVGVLNAPKNNRDDIVAEQIDKLNAQENPARQAFFSEMLCLEFPDLYPVLNKPIKRFLSDIKFRAPYGASEGARYLDLSKKLRVSLLRDPSYPAKNLAELDTIIEQAYKE